MASGTYSPIRYQRPVLFFTFSDPAGRAFAAVLALSTVPHVSSRRTHHSLGKAHRIIRCFTLGTCTDMQQRRPRVWRYCLHSLQTCPGTPSRSHPERLLGLFIPAFSTGGSLATYPNGSTALLCDLSPCCVCGPFFVPYLQPPTHA
jgi:hypothetical protein